MEQNSNNIPELQSPFEQLREVDAEGHEWWNSRKLARLMGYMKYWNFERLMDKVATFLQQEKGLDLKEHMVEIEEMAQLNNGGCCPQRWSKRWLLGGRKKQIVF